MEPKKMAIAILAKKKPETESGDDEDGGEGHSAAAADIIAAVKAGDAAALSAALRDFVAMCQGESSGGY